MQERIDKCIQSVEYAGASGVILQTTARRFTDFLSSIKEQTKSRSLSPGQRKYLEDIESNCSAEKIKEADDWVLNYNDDLREIALICAEYYEHAPDGQSYFREVRRKVIDFGAADQQGRDRRRPARRRHPDGAEAVPPVVQQPLPRVRRPVRALDAERGVRRVVQEEAAGIAAGRRQCAFVRGAILFVRQN